MKVTKNTVVQYRRLLNKIEKLQLELKPHKDKLKSLEAGIYKFDGVAPIQIVEYVAQVLDAQEMAKLDPDLITKKPVHRKRIK